MKVLLAVLLIAGCGAEAARAQTPAPAPSGPATVSPTGLAAAMRHGHMMVLKGGQLVPLTAEMPLANGAKLSPDGKLMMPGGEWMPLHEGDQVRQNGMVVPAAQARQRRVTRFNKHVTRMAAAPVR